MTETREANLGVQTNHASLLCFLYFQYLLYLLAFLPLYLLCFDNDNRGSSVTPLF